METAVWITIIGALLTVSTSVIAPIIMARMTAAQRNSDRDAEWARQDLLEDRRKQTAERIAETVKQAALDVATKTEASRAALGSQLTDIHMLVNGKVTETLRDELASLIREVTVRRENVALKEKTGETVSPVELATIDLAELRIKDLRSKLGEKLDLDIQVLEKQKDASLKATTIAEQATIEAQETTDVAVAEKTAAIEETNKELEKKDDAAAPAPKNP